LVLVCASILARRCENHANFYNKQFFFKSIKSSHGTIPNPSPVR
jgi:hypothetical protein